MPIVDDPNKDKPNPGSEEARALGCNCPIYDNNRGKFSPMPPDDWFVRDDCPIHAFDISPPV